MQQPSYGESDPSTQPSWRGFLELCKPPWLLFVSFMLAKPVLLGWFFQVLLVWNVAWFLYTTVIVVSVCLWGWPRWTCFHRLPFWISKLVVMFSVSVLPFKWISQVRIFEWMCGVLPSESFSYFPDVFHTACVAAAEALSSCTLIVSLYRTLAFPEQTTVFIYFWFLYWSE